MARPLGRSPIRIHRPDLGLTFGKSSQSNVQNCPFAAETDESVFMLDSKDEQGPVLEFSRPAFTAFARSAHKLRPIAA